MEIKFGTDGWRGVMARDFTFDNVRRVAQAIADYLKTKPHKTKAHHTVVVGYDRRFQSESFAEEIARILQANGHTTFLLAETLPTPAISLMTAKLKAVGVVVTASHNPPAYNGVKIKLEGRAAPESVTAEVETFLGRAVPLRNGPVARKSYKKEYLAYLRSQIDPSRFMGKLPRPALIDYMHGAAGGLMGELCGSLNLIEMRAEHDPLFGGVNPEPVDANLKALKERVLAEKALIGIALDGDADRVAVVDDKGRYLTPCQVFPILLDYLIGTRGLKGKIVQSVSMGYLSGRIAAAYGLPFEELPVGFKHVGEQIALGEAAMGGEESGGYAWKGGLPERDGLLTGLLMLEICAKLKKTPSQLWEAIEKKYGKSSFRRVDFHVSKPVADKAVFTAKIQKKLPQKLAGTPIKTVLSLDGIKVILADDHWLLMRPSGTEPLIRTYAESDSAQKTQTLLETAAKWVNAHI
jgi:phosphomannomutase